MEKSTTIREKMKCLQRNMSSFEDVFQLKTKQNKCLLRRSNLQTFIISFFVVLILFDLYILHRFSDLLFHLFLAIFIYIYTGIGGPKKCRDIFKLNKYKDKINTTKQFICWIS